MRASSYALALDRFVQGSGSPTRLDDEGFLLHPAAGRWSGTSDRPRPVTELVTGSGSFVLLAAGGMGKTTTLRALADIEPRAQYYDLVTLEVSEIKAMIRQAARDRCPAYLDSLDQAAASDQRLYRILGEELVRPGARQGA